MQALLSLPRCPPEHRHACSGAGPPAGNSNYRARSTISYPIKYSIGPARTTSHVLWRRPYRFLRRPPEQRRTCSGAGPPIGNSFIIWPILAQASYQGKASGSLRDRPYLIPSTIISRACPNNVARALAQALSVTSAPARTTSHVLWRGPSYW